ncbi:hypothetical protein SAY87_028720 [Trapa incisa]|uniref:Uncharacterized protein n=1 Tax=Trapa incisa TaxID=236973 RepID=A0AAN7QQD3_9MYRT|nr:hypothetical protein SAY87_028720 [Trapa incisa]
MEKIGRNHPEEMISSSSIPESLYLEISCTSTRAADYSHQHDNHAGEKGSTYACFPPRKENLDTSGLGPQHACPYYMPGVVNQKIDVVPYEALRAFVSFMHTAEACMDEQLTSELLVLAEKHLKSYYENFLVSKLNWDDSVMNYAFAHQHNELIHTTRNDLSF